MKNKPVIVTGVRSGLGKYVFENLDIPGILGITRSTTKKEWEDIKNSGASTIIHCAFNSSRPTQDELYEYFKDNVILTEKLTQIPHDKFIFISTIDVYPKDGEVHKEDEEINPAFLKGVYPISKLISESIVKKNGSECLILRCSAFIGEDSRKNSLIKIIKDSRPSLALSGESEFNYILHKDVLNFIKDSLKDNLSGIYNVASSENICLKKISEIVGKEAEFGECTYMTGSIDNLKISGGFSRFRKTSREIINEYVNQRR